MTSVADTYVDEDAPNANNGNEGSIDVFSLNGANERSLVRFSLPVLPGGCSVTSAVLRLDTISHNSGRTLHAKRVTSSWAENSVTWNTQPTSTTTALAATASGGGYVDFTVTAQVGAMYAGTNDGFLIRDSSEDGPGALQIYSSREDGFWDPPKLTITYG